MMPGTGCSSKSMRSPAASELASELVPNTARPTLFATSHLHWRTKRSVSGLKSALNGVTTGDSTPVMRWIMVLAPDCVVTGRVSAVSDLSEKAEIAAVHGRKHALDKVVALKTGNLRQHGLYVAPG